MVKSSAMEPFAAYSSLLDQREGLQAELDSVDDSGVVAVCQQIADTEQRIGWLQAQPDVAESALMCGSVLAAVIENGGDEDEVVRGPVVRRLRQAAAVVMEQSATRPELAEDTRFYDIQAALGIVGTEVTVEAVEPAAPPMQVNYDAALKSLERTLAEMDPDTTYTLNPAQLLTLAAPGMAMSRWQRYSFLCKAQKLLTERGYVCRHNSGRGRSSRYTVGRPATRNKILPLAA